jgi:integrase
MPKLTAASIKRLSRPATGQLDYPDDGRDGVGGLAVRVSAKGRRNFVLRTRLGGKQIRLTLGEFAEDYGLARARDDARKAKRLASQGIDPRAEFKRLANAEKVADERRLENVAARFVEHYAKPTQRQWKETERILKRYWLPLFGERDVATLTRYEIQEALARFAEDHGAIMSNRCLAALRKMLTWSLLQFDADKQPLLEVLPIVPGMAKSERPFKRERVLNLDEIKRLWHAADTMGYPYSHATRLLLATAQRRGEVSAMRWQDIDLERRVWTVPAAMNKSGRPHSVPLSDLCCETLDDCTENKVSETFVLATRKDRPINGWSKAKAMLASASAVENWRIHDLRRSAATYMRELGASRLTVSKVLNHADASITGVYDLHAADVEKRDALDKWAERLQSLP